MKKKMKADMSLLPEERAIRVEVQGVPPGLLMNSAKSMQLDEDLLDLLDEMRISIEEYLKRESTVTEKLRELRALLDKEAHPK